MELYKVRLAVQLEFLLENLRNEAQQTNELASKLTGQRYEFGKPTKKRGRKSTCSGFFELGVLLNGMHLSLFQKAYTIQLNKKNNNYHYNF